jgi:hypothetical protein
MQVIRLYVQAKAATRNGDNLIEDSSVQLLSTSVSGSTLRPVNTPEVVVTQVAQQQSNS